MTCHHRRKRKSSAESWTVNQRIWIRSPIPRIAHTGLYSYILYAQTGLKLREEHERVCSPNYLLNSSCLRTPRIIRRLGRALIGFRILFMQSRVREDTGIIQDARTFRIVLPWKPRTSHYIKSHQPAEWPIMYSPECKRRSFPSRDLPTTQKYSYNLCI
jgi:hypothetical protein